MTRLTKTIAAAASVAALAAAMPAAAQYATPYPYGTYNSNPYGAYNPYTASPYGTYPSTSTYPQSNYSNYYNNYYNQYRGQNAYQNNAYGNAYGNSYNRTAYAEQACTSTVQARLQSRVGLSGIVSALLGGRGASRVDSITQASVNRSGTINVKGLATSNSLLSRYGAGAYGALGYGYAQNPDLEFRCTVDRNNRVTNVDIRRR